MISFEIAGHISGEIETNRQEFFNAVVLCSSFKDVRSQGSSSAIESDHSFGLVEPDGDDRDTVPVFAQSVLLGGGEALGPTQILQLEESPHQKDRQSDIDLNSSTSDLHLLLERSSIVSITYFALII